jgi:hypothetical protein
MFILQCDLLDMPAVAQLEKDEKYQSVYELLKIFLTQRLDSYLEFQSANSTLLQGYGMSCWTNTNNFMLLHFVCYLMMGHLQDWFMRIA